jgi:Na+-translocating ferredoxin:NAD+ oxidoreductase RnfG subunit
MFSAIFFTEENVQTLLASRSDEQTLEILRQIFPEADYYILSDDIYYMYNNGGGKIGYAFYGKGHGYGGEMTIMIGLKDKDTIQGIIVVSNHETYNYWSGLIAHNFFNQFKG